LYSEQFNDAYWSKGQATITANATTAPNGTLTAEKFIEGSGSVTPEVSRTPIATSNSIFTLSVFAKASERNFLIINNNTGVASRRAWFNLSTGVVGTTAAGTTAFIENVGNGWFRCSLTTDIANFGSATSAFQIGSADGVQTYTGDGTSGIFIWGAQMETGDIATPYIPTTTAAVSVGITADIPRLDYTGGGCPSLLLEPQRTNLITFSEQLNNAAWISGEITITANNTNSPDGYVNADKVVSNTNNALHFIGPALTAFVSGTAYTSSVFVKKDTGRYFQLLYGSGGFGVTQYANFDLQLGTVTFQGAAASAKIDNFGNGWYRCAITSTSTQNFSDSCYSAIITSGTAARAESHSTALSYWVYGYQIEAGSYVSSYIPSLGSSVTRLADLAQKTSASALIGQTEGTIFWEIDLTIKVAVDSDDLLNLDNGSFGDTIYLYKVPDGRIACDIYVGSAQEANFILPAASVNVGIIKMALGYANNNSAFFVNGVQVGTTDTSCTIPAMNRIQLGNTAVGASFSRTSQAALYTTRLSNAELQSLTSL
jgi:hypothetical protein